MKELREIQRPLKQSYRESPASARITLTARGSQTDAPVACSVDLGRARVGFETIRLRLEVDAPDASAEQLEALREKTHRYCVVLHTLREPPEIELA